MSDDTAKIESLGCSLVIITLIICITVYNVVKLTMGGG